MTTATADKFKVWAQIERVPVEGEAENLTEEDCVATFDSEAAACAFVDGLLAGPSALSLAAPAMLAALREVLPIIESLDIGREPEDEEMPILAQIRALIAKATA